MHITRQELKARAKAVLNIEYWWFLAALMIYELLPMLVTPSINFMFLFRNLSYTIAYPIIGGILLFSLLVSIFLVTPLYMAVCRFILKRSVNHEAPFMIIWETLKNNYFKLVKAGFMRDIFLLLWSLPYIVIMSIFVVFIPYASSNLLFLAATTLAAILSVILLLYKSYSYSMVTFVMADCPETGWHEALSESKELMAGKTFYAFKLDLSFIGWQFLGLLAFGIGVYFVTPYITATSVQFYLSLKTENINL